MKIAIPSVQTPFIKGGANIMTENLKKALIKEGHQVEIITTPFKFFPNSAIYPNIDFWENQDFNELNGIKVDLVISLQFPSYYLRHDSKILWLMHQHRAVYDLYNPQKATSSLEKLKQTIQTKDNIHLSSYKKKFTISKRVAQRLKQFNNIEANHLYHPPQNADSFFVEDFLDYIFYPSRLSALKRQDMIIKAFSYTNSPAKLLIAGEGSFYNHYKNLIDKLDLNHKVKLIGYISDSEKLAFYANSLAVAFIPKDEDYGYITLEAMLSKKPVITTDDSGGVLEFVINNQTGFITSPDPKALAQKIDSLYHNRQKAKAMGENGYDFYKSLNISWQNVTSSLLEGI